MLNSLGMEHCNSAQQRTGAASSPPPLRMPSRSPRRRSATASCGCTSPRMTLRLPRACVGARRCDKCQSCRCGVLLLAPPRRTCARVGAPPPMLPLQTMKKLLLPLQTMKKLLKNDALKC
ncbi:hypothetical protein SETIT_3G268900v2 [Setaria italica]|uniref:Uncharacterized protein n=2 Tax=Setaria italica TaxID=4555 RepID=A0A368QJ95_SETIT|nr:hypothetical protein SETIT_3G268900v2 [Setaria italica]